MIYDTEDLSKRLDRGEKPSSFRVRWTCPPPLFPNTSVSPPISGEVLSDHRLNTTFLKKCQCFELLRQTKFFGSPYCNTIQSPPPRNACINSPDVSWTVRLGYSLCSHGIKIRPSALPLIGKSMSGIWMSRALEFQALSARNESLPYL